MSFAIFHDTKTYYKLTILIIFLQFFNQTYSLEQCWVDKTIVENEKLFSHIVWSPNSIYDDSSNGTILVNELTTLIFTCKSNAYRFVVIYIYIFITNLRLFNCDSNRKFHSRTFSKVEKILKGSLDVIRSHSVKIQIIGGKVCISGGF